MKPPERQDRCIAGRKIADRKERFEALNEFVIKRNGWITSVPGAPEVMVEVLVDSGLPDALAELGYCLVPEGVGERIVPGVIVETLTRRVDGQLEPLVEGSTKPIVRIEHSGIVRTKRFSFEMQ
jgi:hypothetical protein